MANLKIIYDNINGYASKKKLMHYFTQTNEIDCIMCVETKLKDNISPFQDWNIVQQKGNILNTKIRGGALVQANPEVKMGKANPPVINNYPNNCIHVTFPFRKTKIHIFLVYIHPTSEIEETILTKASLYEYSIIIGDLNPNARKKQQIDFFIQNTEFVKLYTPPTFIMANNPSSTPDIILCTKNIETQIKTSITTDLGSDHHGILWTLELGGLPSKEQGTKEVKYNLQKCNMFKVNQGMLEFLQEEIEISELYIDKFNQS